MIPTYHHHSPSSLNQFAASPALFVLERILGLKQVVGAPAHRLGECTYYPIRSKETHAAPPGHRHA